MSMHFSLIDENFSIYKQKKVYIWGAGSRLEDICNKLSYYGITIQGIIDNNPEKIGTDILGYKVISPNQLNTSDSLVQLAFTFSEEIKEQLEKLNIDTYISLEEFDIRYEYLPIYKYVSECPGNKNYYLNEIFHHDLPPENWIKMLTPLYWKEDIVRILCMPPKTGDWSVLLTIDQPTNKLIQRRTRMNRIYSALNCWHTGDGYKEIIEYVSKHYPDKKIKLVTAAREPISQNISELFQCACRGIDLSDQDFYWKNGGDVKAAFEFMLKKCIHPSNSVKDFYDRIIIKRHYHFFIQNYFEEEYEKKMGIPILSLPFDKERGYSEYRINNQIELAVYQLEKLDQIYPSLISFLELKDGTRPIKDHDSKSKFYSKYYQQALKEITFNQEYFDWSFSSKYLHHFYTEEQIKQFMNRWDKHIER